MLKIAFSAITHRPICQISAKLYTNKQNNMLVRATGQKLQIVKIQDGGRVPFWKSLNSHISVKNCPILLKLGIVHQILNTITWPKSEIFKTQHGGGRRLENRFFGHNSSTDCPISAKFCMRKQNVKSPYVSEKLSDFVETWYTASDIEPDDSHVTKNWNF